MTYAIGQRVISLAGGPVMVVSLLPDYTTDHTVLCRWFYKGKFDTQWFHRDELVLYGPTGGKDET